MKQSGITAVYMECSRQCDRIIEGEYIGWSWSRYTLFCVLCLWSEVMLCALYWCWLITYGFKKLEKMNETFSLTRALLAGYVYISWLISFLLFTNSTNLIINNPQELSTQLFKVPPFALDKQHGRPTSSPLCWRR